MTFASLEREAEQLMDEVWVFDARRLRGLRKARVGSEITVGVDVDDEGTALRVDPEVDPGVVAEPERAERAERRAPDAAGERLVGAAEGRDRSLVLGGAVVPLGAVADDARHVL